MELELALELVGIVGMMNVVLHYTVNWSNGDWDCIHYYGEEADIEEQVQTEEQE